MGTKVGEESHTVTSGEMPGPHSHSVNARVNGTTSGSNAAGPGVILASGYSTQDSTTVAFYVAATSPLGQMTSLGTTGGQPHENRMPFNVLNYCICTAGIFPSRS